VTESVRQSSVISETDIELISIKKEVGCVFHHAQFHLTMFMQYLIKSLIYIYLYLYVYFCGNS